MGRHGAVALVDEAQARDGVATHLSIDGDGLRLDAADGTEHEDGAVEDAGARSTSMVKSAGGVSMMLMLESSVRYVAADWIVMPLGRFGEKVRERQGWEW